MRGRMEAGRALRTRGTAEEGLLARPERPRRCTLPITALRVTPPSSAAIWLADKPSAQSFFSNSTRSSVQFIVFPPGLPLRPPPLRPVESLQVAGIGGVPAPAFGCHANA